MSLCDSVEPECRVSTQSCLANADCTSNECFGVEGAGENVTQGQCTLSPMADFVLFSFITFIWGAIGILLICFIRRQNRVWKAARSRRERQARMDLDKEASFKRKSAFQFGVDLGEVKKHATILLHRSSALDANLAQAMVNTYLRQVGPMAQQTLWKTHVAIICTTVFVLKQNDDFGSSDNAKHVVQALQSLEAALASVRQVISHAQEVHTARATLDKTASDVVAACKTYSWLITWPEGDSYFDQFPPVAETLATKTTGDAQIGDRSPGFDRLKWTALSVMPAFPSVGNTAKSKPRWFARFRRHPGFYSTYWVLAIAIFVSFLARINTSNEAMNAPGRFRPSGFGKTFLKVPPQYDIAENTLQGIFVPIIYGFMHNALFGLGLLPLLITRGLWRDAVHYMPWLPRYVPLNDFEYLHKVLGFLVLLYILSGAGIWISVMYVDCFIKEVPNSCMAFEAPRNVIFNPIINVAALRASVFLTWFPFFPLMYSARRGPHRYVVRVFGPIGRFLRQYWFEICLYSHIAVALITLTLALISRFEVFYPVLPAWALYAFDRAREYTTRQFELEFDADKGVTVYNRSGGVGSQPTSMRLVFNCKKAITCLRSKFAMQAGQWVYLQVPSIDRTWHAFSLASPSSNESLELHIGIIASAPDQWVAVEGDQKRTLLHWDQKNPTWTFQLLKRLRGSRNPPNTAVRVMGPYGTAFSTCFERSNAAAVIVGAGTGLTASESVLRETVARRRLPDPAAHPPMRTWFVWSCRSVDDLYWAWDGLVATLLDAVQDGTLDISKHSDLSQCMDWLHVTLYVTERDAATRMEAFKESIALGHANLNEGTTFGSLFADRERQQYQHPEECPTPSSATSDVSSVSAQSPMPQDKEDTQDCTTMILAPATTPPPLLEPASFDQLESTPALVSSSDFAAAEQEEKGAASSTHADNTAKVLIENWLLTRIVTKSMDSHSAHIDKLLRGVRDVCDIDYPDMPITVCYCGSAVLGNVIQEAVHRLAVQTNSKAHFNSDHQ